MKYLVDVVSGCNLRCLFCPEGNSPDVDRPKGLMSLALFREIIAKIRADNRGGARVALYNWTEPFLHPKLPELVRIANADGMQVTLSSNFNISKGLDEIVAAGIRSITASVSGFSQETYSRAHIGGNVEVVKENLHKLREALDRSGKKTKVKVAYHCYTYNTMADDLVSMSGLCRQLDFSFRPAYAYLMPIEKALEYYDGRMPEEERASLGDLLVHPDKCEEISSRHPSDDCILRSEQTVINCDGSVALCCGVYDVEHTIAKSYLDVAQGELQEAKHEHRMCKECMSHGVHITSVYGGLEEWHKAAMEKLGVRELPRDLVAPPKRERKGFIQRIRRALKRYR